MYRAIRRKLHPSVREVHTKRINSACFFCGPLQTDRHKIPLPPVSGLRLGFTEHYKYAVAILKRLPRLSFHL